MGQRLGEFRRPIGPSSPRLSVVNPFVPASQADISGIHGSEILADYPTRYVLVYDGRNGRITKWKHLCRA